MPKFKKGCIPWNKGTNIQTNDALKKWKEAGGQIWSKGRKIGKQSKEWVVKRTEARKGYKHSEETKEKIGFSNSVYIGEKHWRWIKDRLKIKNRRLIYARKRRRLLKTLTLETIQRVYEDNIKKYGTLTCYLCIKPIPFGKDTLEHKTPLCRGGTNLYENLAIAHRRCNSKKSFKTEEEYQNEL